MHLGQDCKNICKMILICLFYYREFTDLTHYSTIEDSRIENKNYINVICHDISPHISGSRLYLNNSKYVIVIS